MGLGLLYMVEVFRHSDIPEYRLIGDALKDLSECETSEARIKYIKNLPHKNDVITAIVVESVARSIRWDD